MIRSEGDCAHESVVDLHFDGALARVRGDVERLDGLLQLEAVRHERLEVDQPAGDEPDGFGVLQAERSARASE
jgi:hypothetical protein